MTRQIIFFSGLISMLILSGCSKEKQLSNRLEGRWSISVYQKTVYAEGEPVMEESNSYENAGTFEFLKNGTGLFNILVDLGEGTYTDNGDFTWTNTADVLSIKYNGFIEKFDVIKNSKNEIEIMSYDADFYFTNSEPGILYTMEERIVLSR